MAKATEKTNAATVNLADLFEGMTPEEIREILGATGQATNTSFDKTPTLKVNKYPIKDAKGNSVPMGNFVYNQITKQEGKNTIIEDIGIDCGANPEITIVKFGTKFSFFPDSEKVKDAKKHICQSQLVLDPGEKAVGDNLGHECMSRTCPRRAKNVLKDEKCTCQYQVFVQVKVGEDTKGAIMYFKGTSFLPFKQYLDSAGKFPLYFFPTLLTTEQQINGTNIYWVVTPVLQKDRPYPLEERKLLTETVKAVDESVRGFESQRKLISATRKEEAQKSLPPGMSIEGKGAGNSGGLGAGAQDADFDNIVF